MVASKEMSEKECRNPGCSGKVSTLDDNAIPFSGCACLTEVYPCSICGLVHHEDGRYIHDRTDLSIGLFYRSGRFNKRPINKKEGKNKKKA